MSIRVNIGTLSCSDESPNGMHTAVVRTMGLGPGWADCPYCGEKVRRFADTYWVADCPVIREEAW